jgi:anti-sigma regulatory factor (Ser/Thr protein kinase)
VRTPGAGDKAPGASLPSMVEPAREMTLTVQQTGFRHEALLYTDENDFVRKVGAFITDSVESEEPILVAVSERKIGRLRDELGRMSDAVSFADVEDIGANPARYLPAWRDYVDQQSARSSARFRGIGEPIWSGRSADELVECQRHEGLLNVAFDGAPAWWLVCPYDTSSLDASVIDEVYRTHPGVINGDETEESATYRDVFTTSRPFGAALPEPDFTDDEFTIAIENLDTARRRVAEHMTTFGMDDLRTRDFILAVSEVATNSLRYGGGRGDARVWTNGETFVFEIRDHGVIDRALAGRIRPTPGQPSGYGLWLANQVCDLVQIRTFGSGSVVRLHMSRAA